MSAEHIPYSQHSFFHQVGECKAMVSRHSVLFQLKVNPGTLQAKEGLVNVESHPQQEYAQCTRGEME